MHAPSLFRRSMPVLLALAMLIICLGTGAAEEFEMWAVFPVMKTPADCQGAKELNTVDAWRSERRGTYYLFLPANADLSALTLHFKGTKKLLIDGKPVSSGAAAALPSVGESVRLATDHGKFTLHVMRSENLPAVFINTSSGSLDSIHHRKDQEEPGSMLMVAADGSVLYNGRLTQIKGRGNWTFSQVKKPYQIKLAVPTDLCGLGKAKTWILLANHYDNSLLRNKISLALADAAGLAFTSKTQAVDLYLNNEYRGSYLLCEKIQIGDSRVEIRDLEKATEKLNAEELSDYRAFRKQYGKGSGKGRMIPNEPADVSGGYLLELEYQDRYLLEPSGVVTTRGQCVIIKEPAHAGPRQVDYVYELVQGFENAIFSPDGIDPVSKKHYSEFVNLESLAKKYLVEEITKNYDGNRSSLFFYKPADSQSTLAFCGPAWDYDIALGNYATSRNQMMVNPQFFVTNVDRGEPYYWFPALFKQMDFRAAVVKAFREDFLPGLRDLAGRGNAASGLLTIQEYADEIRASADMNFVRYPIFNSGTTKVRSGKDYPENIAYLHNFVSRRLDFLAGYWLYEPQEQVPAEENP